MLPSNAGFSVLSHQCLNPTIERLCFRPPASFSVYFVLGLSSEIPDYYNLVFRSVDLKMPILLGSASIVHTMLTLTQTSVSDRNI